MPEKRKVIKVPSGYVGVVTPETTVEIDKDGGVHWQGDLIGYVRKGTRRYSPPLHKGSRIARYHRQVPEWQGGPTIHGFLPRHRADTRQRVLQWLIRDALEASD